MALPALLKDRLTLPLIGSPLFIISNPDLVLAQCLAGVVGSFPALNARPKELLDEWLTRITTTLDQAQEAEPARRIAPFAVNQIIHSSNDRLDHDMDLCVKHRVPIIITSLSAPTDYVRPVHAYGGLVFHDVTNVKHAQKALDAGVDGLILVCAGAGGHAGTMSPFALVSEVRRFFDGPIALSGSITSGAHVAAALALGADLAYVGTRFIATPEANAQEAYKQMIVDSAASEVTYTPLFTGVHGNYLTRSIANAGLDPANLPTADKSSMNFATTRVKPWKDVWGAGQGVGNIDEVLPTAELVARMAREYRGALAQIAA
ncbi:NAD(P)H-dependent flavin oxidoreductase [Variovorax sp. JS1663]|uniref:NAD(P)H-dependent flavin oxidoreductase n=1 Tax=Variovorax sp. JS1663 TaxID=1851577 RepID=UPI000B34614A|nr:nitronate monooxygenase family protein [Variovorax sp. JS1663]OUM03297.1 2-nitropropane dioxygenase [Variovorax sp. JS1663]